MPTRLETIVAHVAEAVATRRRTRPLAAVVRAAAAAPVARGLARNLVGAPGGIGLIAELKPASPSAGRIREDFAVAPLAAALAAGGADALSVLTEPRFFHGHLENLARAGGAGLPRLQKDFVLDPYQVYEARAAGADAILLIAEALAEDRAAELRRLALELGMDVLYEAHDPKNLPRVVEAAAADPERVLVGINNRDLHTFEIRLETTLEALAQVPDGLLVVSESGIRTAAEVHALRQAGVRAILVGETLMRAADVEAAARGLMARVRDARSLGG